MCDVYLYNRKNTNFHGVRMKNFHRIDQGDFPREIKLCKFDAGNIVPWGRSIFRHLFVFIYLTALRCKISF